MSLSDTFRFPPTSREERRTLMMLTLPWLVPGMIASWQIYVIEAAHTPISVADSIMWQMGAWMQWAAWILIIRHVVLAFPVDRIGAGKWVALHASATVIVAAAQLSVLALFDRIFNPPYLDAPWSRIYRVEMLLHLDFTVMVYWTMLGTIYMIEFHRRFRQRDLDAAKLSAQLAAAQLETLRMQLNPHFLFNALNGVGELLHSDPSLANRIIARISELLRQALRSGASHEIPLWRELELADAYLDIARMRFGSALSVDVSVAPAAMDVLVPALILQPLLENAFHHGFGARSNSPRLEIVASVAGDRLRLSVQDNGNGVSSTEAPGFGIGLSNTRSRLEAMYGEGATLLLETPLYGGFLVVIELPARVKASSVDHAKAS
jgi:signal transduction histidine kinase